MFRVLSLLLLFAVPALALSAEGGSSKASMQSKPVANKQERQFADSIAKAMMEKRRAFIGQNLSPMLLKAYGDEANLHALSTIQTTYGDIRGFQFENTTTGSRPIADQSLPFVIYWYSVVTSTHPTGRYMKVQVSKESGRYYVAGYEVLQFMGEAPSFLK